MDAGRRWTRWLDGIEIEGMKYGPIEGKLDRVQGANCWLTLGLREGKNREVRRIMDHMGLVVNRLIRVSFGPFALSESGTGRGRRGETAGARRSARRRIGSKPRPEGEAPAPGRGDGGTPRRPSWKAAATLRRACKDRASAEGRATACGKGRASAFGQGSAVARREGGARESPARPAKPRRERPTR